MRADDTVLCVERMCISIFVHVFGRTPTFQSQHGNLLEFVCLALKSSLGSHEAHGDRAARSPSGRPNDDAALNLATLGGTPHKHTHTQTHTDTCMNKLTHRQIASSALFLCSHSHSALGLHHSVLYRM